MTPFRKSLLTDRRAPSFKRRVAPSTREPNLLGCRDGADARTGRYASASDGADFYPGHLVRRRRGVPRGQHVRARANLLCEQRRGRFVVVDEFRVMIQRHELWFVQIEGFSLGAYSSCIPLCVNPGRHSHNATLILRRQRRHLQNRKDSRGAVRCALEASSLNTNSTPKKANPTILPLHPQYTLPKIIQHNPTTKRYTLPAYRH